MLVVGLLPACGGGGIGGEETPPANPWWVTVSSPIEGSGGVSYVAAPGKPAVSMTGHSFVSPTWWGIGPSGATAGVTVTWLNETTGDSGAAATHAVVKISPLGSSIDSNDWSAAVPVKPGPNRVTVTASDPSGRTGTVTVDFTTLPLAEITAGTPAAHWGAAPIFPPAGTPTDPADPFNTTAQDGRAQFLVLASELLTSGVAVGASLQEIHLHCDVNGSPLQNVRVRVQGTSSATSTAFVSGGWTTTCGPLTVAPAGGSWCTLTFAVPFVWNGTDNLFFDVSRDDSANGSLGGLLLQTGLSSRMTAGWADSASDWPFDTGLAASVLDAIPELRVVWSGP